MLTIELRNKLITENISFAEQIAATQFRRIPKFVSFDEVKSAAYMGLVLAASKYREEAAVPFRGFAIYRITGEIKDYLRFRYRGGIQIDENLDVSQ